MYAIELAIEFNENIVLVGDLNSSLLCVSNTNLVDIMKTFGGREFCTCITFCCTRQLFSTTLIGRSAFKGPELCVTCITL